MARTTDALVEAIIEVDATIPLAPFISAANMLVTKHCSAFTDYTEDNLTEIETWLAAHCYATRDPRISDEQAGSIRAKYQSVIDLGLNNSHYGQIAMMLDWNGGLAAMNDAAQSGKRSSASVTWVGTPEDEATADPTQT